jgi:hypothetical protein
MPKFRFVLSSITLAAAVLGASAPVFRAGKASDYANQKSENVIVGAKPFDSDALVAEAFGKKVNPLRYGILPVLVVIENDRKQSIDLRDMEVTLVGADGQHISATSPEDLFYKGTPKRKPSSTGQVPLPFPLPKPKNSLNGSELRDQSFAVRFLPPGETASGFFYFAARSQSGDTIYINGLHEEPSHRQLLYFEFALESSPRTAGS